MTTDQIKKIIPELTRLVKEELLRDYVLIARKPEFSHQEKEIFIDFVFRFVASYRGITVETLKAKTNKQESVHPRYEAFYLIKNITGDLIPLDLTGSYVGKDHATVIHGINVITTEAETSAKYRTDIGHAECMLIDEMKDDLKKFIQTNKK